MNEKKRNTFMFISLLLVALGFLIGGFLLDRPDPTDTSMQTPDEVDGYTIDDYLTSTSEERESIREDIDVPSNWRSELSSSLESDHPYDDFFGIEFEKKELSSPHLDNRSGFLIDSNPELLLFEEETGIYYTYNIDSGDNQVISDSSEIAALDQKENYAIHSKPFIDNNEIHGFNIYPPRPYPIFEISGSVIDLFVNNHYAIVINEVEGEQHAHSFVPSDYSDKYSSSERETDFEFPPADIFIDSDEYFLLHPNDHSIHELHIGNHSPVLFDIDESLSYEDPDNLSISPNRSNWSFSDGGLLYINNDEIGDFSDIRNTEWFDDEILFFSNESEIYMYHVEEGSQILFNDSSRYFSIEGDILFMQDLEGRVFEYSPSN